MSDDTLAERRKARQELEWLHDVEVAARHLDHLLSLGPPGLPSPSDLLKAIEARTTRLAQQGTGHLPPRQRPRQKWRDRWDPSRPRARVFIDETGLSTGIDPAAPYFATVAVIVNQEEIDEVEAHVKEWQLKHFGRERYVHELDIRKRTGAFYFDGDSSPQEAALADLRQLISDLPYRATGVVIDKDRFWSAHPSGRVDGILPTRVYPLAVHMLFERVVHHLWHSGDRKGDVEAEGVGEKEDAYVQQAVAHLKLDGTRFQSERWFRYQLADHVAFYGKAHNRAGLQLADWVAKPLADAARAAREPALRVNGKVPHEMWEAIRPHLYDGGQGREDTFGLKVYPPLNREERLWLFPEANVDDLPVWEPTKLKGPEEEPRSP